MTSEIERLRAEQRRAAEDARNAPNEREREYCMLGVNDYLVEELIVMYWGKLSAISGQQSAALAES